jgi:hypothetical protein
MFFLPCNEDDAGKALRRGPLQSRLAELPMRMLVQSDKATSCQVTLLIVLDSISLGFTTWTPTSAFPRCWFWSIKFSFADQLF